MTAWGSTVTVAAGTCTDCKEALTPATTSLIDAEACCDCYPSGKYECVGCGHGRSTNADYCAKCYPVFVCAWCTNELPFCTCEADNVVHAEEPSIWSAGVLVELAKP